VQEQNPYQPPGSKILDVPGGQGVWRQARSLVMLKDAKLPDRCIYCNASTQTVKRRRIFYLNIWLQIILVMLFLVFNVLALLPILIVALVFRKSVVIDIPVCDRHWRHRVILTLTTLLLLMVALALAVLLVEVEQFQKMLLSLSLVCLFLSILFALVTGRMLRASKIDADLAILKGAKKPFLDSLPGYEEIV
jgi:hypothetical protein